jgi:hypothetical protein
MGLMNDNYQRWLDGEIGDSELNRLQAQANRLFTLEEVHALEVSAVKATEERIIKLLTANAITQEDYSVGHSESDPLIYLDIAIALIKGENK